MENRKPVYIDRSTLVRAQELARSKPAPVGLEIRAISFDARKDQTLTLVDDLSGSKRPRIVAEDHEAIVGWPGEVFLGVVYPEPATGAEVARLVFEKVQESSSIEFLDIVGGDNTSSNTGYKNGAFRNLEILINRPLQRNCCFIHFCELPARNLLSNLIGEKSGPSSRKGLIGEQLGQSIESMKIVPFVPLPNEQFPNVSDDFMQKLSTDQRYFYLMSKGIISGNISTDLEKTKPGPHSDARWLNQFSRLLRIYAATANPPHCLVRMVHYIIYVYGPSWLLGKWNYLMKDGPQNFLRLAKLQKEHCTPEELEIVEKNLRINFYWAHEESVLMSMLCNDERGDRELAVMAILDVRERFVLLIL